MRLFTFIVMLFFVTSFCSCENHMDINDIVEGTPSNADTVLHHKFPPVEKHAATPNEVLPREFRTR